MSDPTSITPPPPMPAGQRLASWGERAGALLIDVGIVLAGVIVLALLGNASSFFTWLAVLWYFGSYGWFQWIAGTQGQSPGKGLLGLKLVGASTGAPIGGVQGLLRWGVTWVLNICCIGGILDYLWPLWDDRNQTLHDKAMGSIVLTGQPKRSGARLFQAD